MTFYETIIQTIKVLLGFTALWIAVKIVLLLQDIKGILLIAIHDN